MSRKSIMHIEVAQTSPDIYAARMRYARESANAGTFDQWTLCATLGGECRWRIEDAAVTTWPGDLLVTRPHVKIAWRNSSALDKSRQANSITATDGIWECCYTVFLPRPHWHVWLDAMDFKQGLALMHFEGAAFEKVIDELSGLVSAFEKGGLLRDEWALNALERVLLTLYSLSTGHQNGPDKRVQAAVEFIHAGFADPMTTADIARASGLSISRLSALFAATLGVAPVQYLERVRLARAAEMLLFGVMSIGKISSAAGFTQPYYFARRFRLHYGKSPSQYREDGQSKQAWADSSPPEGRRK